MPYQDNSATPAEQPTNTEAPPCPPWTAGAVGYIKRKLDKDRTKRAQEKPEEKAARVTAWATVWIAIFTLVLAFVSYKTLTEVQSGGGQMERQLDVLSKQSRFTARLATPRGAIHRVNWLFLPSPLPPNFRFVDDIGDPTTPFIIGPKGSVTGGVMPVPTDGPFGLENIRNRTGGHMFFWGWTTYRDVFKATPLHVTMFCLELAGIRGQDTRTQNAQDQYLWQNCTGPGLQHNCADEECNGQPYGNPTRVWPN